MKKLSILIAAFVVLLTLADMAQATTYANAATVFNWINATTHTRVGAQTSPYQFRNPGGCGTSPPIIDDTVSDKIPIGFNFTFGDKTFDSVRIMSNGRIQFASTTIPWDNTTCGYGSPVTQIPIPDAGLTYTLRIYGNDLDPTLAADAAPNGYITACGDGKTASNNPCFVSFATVGSAPDRKFVVTWQGVPEWASFSSATGAYNIQIILQENGEFIYQYGTDIAGPQAATAQVGWEISTSDYDTPLVGYPVPNTAIRFFIPHPVVEYLMEQTSWAGTGKVLDTSGNNANGTAAGSVPPTPTLGGKVCKGASFTGAGTQAIDSGVSIPSTIGNTGTIAFWYKAANAWTASSTKDEELLDATTLNGQWFYLTRRGGGGTNGGKLRFVVTDSSGTAQTVETAAINVAANTWKYIAVTWSFNNYIGGNNDHLRIYVDGVQQQQSAFTSTTLTISPSIGSLYLGGTRSSIAGPGGSINSANGVIDEFRAYNYEATQSTIASIMTLNAGGCLDHYAIADSGTGLNCQLSQVTVAAHTANHSGFINNTLVTLSSSDNTGTWILLNGHGTLNNVGTNSGAATYLFNGESQALLGYTHPTANTATFHMTDGTYTEQENTPLVISNCVAGKFNACELSTPRCAPTVGSAAYANLYTKLADTAFNLDLVAVTTTGALDNSFSKQVTVNLLANTNAPIINASSNCPSSQTDTISLGKITFSAGRAPAGGISIAANAFSSAAKKYSAYRDVRAQFVCDAANCGASAGTYCATDGFTVRPQSFTLSSSANADLTGTSPSATPKVKAGTTFTLSADSGTAGYDGTPTIDVTKAEWLSPPTGGLAAPGVGSVSGSFSSAANIATGTGASGNFSYGEVGYFRLQAGGVYDNAYAGVSGDLGNGDCIPGSFSNIADSTGRYGCNVANATATGYFGRFIPDHFSITPGTLTPRSDQSCSPTPAFTYFGEPFSTAFGIVAQNISNATTQNYAGSFATLPLTWSSLAFSASSLPAGASLLDGGAFISSGGGWSKGSVNITASHKTSRIASGTPTAPAGGVTVSAQPIDSDGVTMPVTVVHAGSTGLRFGRLRAENAFGSELLPLSVPLKTEYWNGTAFVTNTLDNCTTLPVPTIVTQSGAAGTTPSYANSPVVAGDPGLGYSKPSSGGYADIKIDLTLGLTPQPWLQYNWGDCLAGAANGLYDDNPCARVTFGKRNNADKIIIRRELY